MNISKRWILKMRIHYWSALDKEYPYTHIIFNQIDNNSKPFFVATTASETRRFVERCILAEQLLIQREIVLKHKKPCKSISQKRRKPKSRSTNFLFWRHSRSRARNSTRSLKPCTQLIKEQQKPVEYKNYSTLCQRAISRAHVAPISLWLG